MLDALRTEFATIASLPWQVFVARILGAIVLCGAIGLEREATDKPAGLRTHMLVGLAACTYTILTLELLDRAAAYPADVRLDPIRVIEAVTSGVAFLAAGLIFFAEGKGKVRGLTTGAGLWLAGAVGVACGLGLWGAAVLVTVPALVIVALVKRIEDRMG